jgi:hypothetical protein
MTVMLCVIVTWYAGRMGGGHSLCNSYMVTTIDTLFNI